MSFKSGFNRGIKHESNIFVSNLANVIILIIVIVPIIIDGKAPFWAMWSVSWILWMVLKTLDYTIHKK